MGGACRDNGVYSSSNAEHHTECSWSCAHPESDLKLHDHFGCFVENLEYSFYHAAVTKPPIVRDLTVVEVSSHLVPAQPLFSTKCLDKPLYDFIGTFFLSVCEP